MVINKVLDEVFSRWSNLAVLRALNKRAVGLSGREVARIAGITNKNCFTALADFENLGIVNCERGGREHSYKLNRQHALVEEAIIPLLQYEENYFDRIASFIKSKFKSMAESLIVYGSVARKEETMDSDYDLCVVVKNAKQKSKAEDRLYELSLSITKKFGVTVSPIYFTKSAFLQKARQNKSPVNNIIKEGKVISGLSIKELLK
ncbi:MAG: nucleotidyltransferase domain-containing protein [Bacteroidetes bacterium]|nr:nucleotidyltransferase domain-containing protein [Bacteroidota bacterium]